jgi:hypothetical protein
MSVNHQPRAKLPVLAFLIAPAELHCRISRRVCRQPKDAVLLNLTYAHRDFGESSRAF